MNEQAREIYPLGIDVSDDGECIVYGYEGDIGVVITGYVFLPASEGVNGE